jgi:hypothetical protein
MCKMYYSLESIQVKRLVKKKVSVNLIQIIYLLKAMLPRTLR